MSDRIRFDLFGEKYQAGERRYKATGPSERCSHCGRKMNTAEGATVLYVHYLTTGEITDDFTSPEIADDQGAFPIGPECAKKIPRRFVKAYTIRADHTLAQA